MRESVLAELPRFAAGLLTLLLTWLVGQRLIVFWNIRQKRREADLNAARDFHSAYGEFFAVWKLWDACLQGRLSDVVGGTARWELLKRASSAEATYEALLVKLVSERALTAEQVAHLGAFRHLVCSLRSAIARGEPLGWSSSDHPDYLLFKRLAPEIAALLIQEDISARRHYRPGENALVEITSGRWRPRVDRDVEAS